MAPVGQLGTGAGKLVQRHAGGSGSATRVRLLVVGAALMALLVCSPVEPRPKAVKFPKKRRKPTTVYQLEVRMTEEPAKAGNGPGYAEVTTAE